jgi:hypothetical protein
MMRRSSLHAFIFFCISFPAWVSASAPLELPLLASGISLDNGQARPAQFYGGIGVDGVFQRARIVDDATPVSVRFAIHPESHALDAPADIFVVFAYAARGPLGLLPPQWFALDAQGQSHALYGEAANWPVFARLVGLPASYQSEIYQGVFQNTGQIVILIGYRGQDGNIVYSPQGIGADIRATAPIPIPIPETPPSVEPTRQLSADFSGNGQDDVLIYADNRVRLYTLINGRWQTLWDSGDGHLFYQQWETLRAGDFNNDGRAELSVGDTLYQFNDGDWREICLFCLRLAIGGEFSGIFSLGADNSLQRFHYQDGWQVEKIPYYGARPASLAHGSGWEYGKIYGLNQDGQLFATWYDGNQVNYGVIDESHDLLPGSAAHGRERDVFALALDGSLVHAAYHDRWVLTNYPDIYLQRPLLPLAPSWPEFVLAALDRDGNLYVLNQAYQLEAVPGAIDLQAGSLVMSPWGTGLFALDKSGQLMQIRHANAVWQIVTYPRWQGNLISLYSGSANSPYGNLYAVNHDGQVLNTWYDGQAIGFGVIAVAAPLQADSLAINDKGVFGLNYQGVLTRLSWQDNAWQASIIAHDAGALRKPLLSNGLSGEYAGVVGMNEFSQVFNSWNNGEEVNFALLP